MRNEAIEILREAKAYFGAEIDREIIPVEDGKLVLRKGAHQPHRGVAGYLKNETNRNLADFLRNRYLNQGQTPQSAEEFVQSYMTRISDIKQV